MARQPGERARFEVLMEEMKSQFQAVIERISFLDQKVDREIARLEQSLGGRLTTLEQAVTMGFRDVRADIRRLEGRMDGFDGWVRNHEQFHTSPRS